MSAAADSRLDLSGDWVGVYSYPGDAPPVSFTASLSETAGWIAGVVEEQSAEGLGPPRRLGASIQGRRNGASTTWLKLYDDLAHGYDAVRYEGSVTPDGEEISGRWSIFSSWSGTFLMVRQSRASVASERSAATRA
jgi:hypothetical protein